MCHANSCYNGGVCKQRDNSYACDCDMTSFSGPTCTEGIVYNDTNTTMLPKSNIFTPKKHNWLRNIFITEDSIVFLLIYLTMGHGGSWQSG